MTSNFAEAAEAGSAGRKEASVPLQQALDEPNQPFKNEMVKALEALTQAQQIEQSLYRQNAGEMDRGRLLGHFAGKAGFLEGVQNFLVIKVASHFKRFGVLLRGLLFDTGNRFHRLVHRGNTLTAA